MHAQKQFSALVFVRALLAFKPFTNALETRSGRVTSVSQNIVNASNAPYMRNLFISNCRFFSPATLTQNGRQYDKTGEKATQLESVCVLSHWCGRDSDSWTKRTREQQCENSSDIEKLKFCRIVARFVALSWAIYSDSVKCSVPCSHRAPNFIFPK